MKTSTGMQGEIQVNTPEMIYAKEKPADARGILGDEAYDAIASKTGLPGGRGHELYEKARVLPPDAPEYQAIAAESREYYGHFR